jgi:uncharacterized protein
MKTPTPFSLLIKPAGADCNLRCIYCFYLEKCNLYPGSRKHRMPDSVLQKLIQSYMATPQPTYSFAWQGGEPTLMGLDFFRRVTELQKSYGKTGDVVSNGIQTNATLIDDAFAEHLGRYRFLAGVSLDGPSGIHDRFRQTRGGGPSHAAVLKGIDALKRHNVEFNILVLVSQANVNRARDVYRYLVDEGFFYHQYIPCVEFDDHGKLLPFAVSGPEWGNFLCEIFDQWYPQDVHSVSIRHFDSLLHKMIDSSVTVCTLGENCCQYFVVEHNGDIYPCDFFVQKDLKLGNVMQTTWNQAQSSPVYREFGAHKAAWNKTCETCEFLNLCCGDCLKHRIYGTHSARNLSRLCSGWNQFFKHSVDKFNELAQTIRLEQLNKINYSSAQRINAVSKVAPVGRNQPCPCGSGKKFKKCCGRT